MFWGQGEGGDIQHGPIDVQLYVVVIVQELEHTQVSVLQVVRHGERAPPGAESRTGTLPAGVLIPHLPRLRLWVPQRHIPAFFREEIFNEHVWNYLQCPRSISKRAMQF